MSEGRPELPDGYLGQQTKFAELQLECVTHPTAEFEIPQDNEVEIKFKAPIPIKSTTNLIQVGTVMTSRSLILIRKFTSSSCDLKKRENKIDYVTHWTSIVTIDFILFQTYLYDDCESRSLEWRYSVCRIVILLLDWLSLQPEIFWGGSFCRVALFVGWLFL